MRRSAAGLLVLAIHATASGASLRVDLPEPGAVTAKLESAVDDAHLANPGSYFPPEPPVARIVRHITVENVGSTPIDNPDLRLNGQPLFPLADPLEALGLAGERDLMALFAKWHDRAVHATTDLDANREPNEILNVIGAGLCGDDARALAAITTAHGAEVRFARLNGHSVTEHRWGGDWVLLDGDQNLFYLGWDNRTPVSEAAVLADPLLALRTQIYGRLSKWEPGNAWRNTSQFEFVDASRVPKPFRLKRPWPKRNWKLMPGEKVVIDFDRSPERVFAANDDLQKNPVLHGVVCVVEFHPASGSRSAGEKLTLPYPALDSTSGAPVYEVEPRDGTAFFCQAARAQFPHLRSGKNVIESKSSGHLQVTFAVDVSERKTPPAPSVRIEAGTLHLTAAGADRVWWQISADSKFRLISPNLDRVAGSAATITLPEIDQTFLSRGEHFLRAKTRHDGVWSDWSGTVRFQIEKPEQPRVAKIEELSEKKVRISWPPEAGEMLVFGSNRFDFLPEVYGDVEPTRLENGAILGSRPNRNLLATVPAESGEAIVPLHACYRLIARDGSTLSVPSALVRVQSAPKPTVLQNRHGKMEGTNLDHDVAVEMEMP